MTQEKSNGKTAKLVKKVADDSAVQNITPGDLPATDPPATDPPESSAKDNEKKKIKKEKGIERFIERAKKLFDKHKVDALYFTEDGQAFIEPQHALMHAGSLKDNHVTEVKREEVK